jgi:hypothetical protein
MKTNIVVLITALTLAVGFAGGYFYRNYRLSQTRRSFGGQFQRNSTGATLGARFGDRPVVGEIISQEDRSFTVKMADGSTKIIILSDSTTYTKTDAGSKDDLKVGSQVGIFGTENSDGSLTAQNVQLNPQFRISSTPTP